MARARTPQVATNDRGPRYDSLATKDDILRASYGSASRHFVACVLGANNRDIRVSFLCGRQEVDPPSRCTPL